MKDNGSVTVTLGEVEGIEPADAEPQEMGVRAKVVRGTRHCVPGRGANPTAKRIARL